MQHMTWCAKTPSPNNNTPNKKINKNTHVKCVWKLIYWKPKISQINRGSTGKRQKLPKTKTNYKKWQGTIQMKQNNLIVSGDHWINVVELSSKVGGINKNGGTIYKKNSECNWIWTLFSTAKTLD